MEIEVSQEIKKQYNIVEDENSLKELVQKIKQSSQMAVSIISDGSNYVFDDIVGLAISPSMGESYYLPLNKETQSDDLFAISSKTKQISENLFNQHLKPLFEGKSILKIGSNIKNIMHFLTKRFGSIDFEPYDDVSVMSYCLSSSEHYHDVNSLTSIYFNLFSSSR